jgi:two-component system phosphate regulon sensor histidine kinase PhoR
LLGQPVHQLLPFLPHADGWLMDGHVSSGSLPDATGRAVDLEVTSTPLPGGQAEYAAAYIIHDVSHHTELNRLREQLLYSVAHELRGPLAVLDSALEILDTELGDLSAGELDRLIRSATRSATRLRGLMDDLLNAGSIQTGRFLIHPRPVALSAIMAEAIEAAEPLVRERRVSIERSLPASALTVRADPGHASRVLLNLLSNAIKYSPAGGCVRVTAEPAGEMARIAVQDRGPGIPSEQQAHLFERFYRVRSRAETPGIGLGLAIAKGIVEAHGGTIGVESEPGRGTTVWFTLQHAGSERERRA